jgi:FtsP/CotA-like multicopper oxidase with cupredoxin domain
MPRRLQSYAAVAGLLVLVGCAGEAAPRPDVTPPPPPPPTGRPAQPAGWNSALALKEAVDTNPAPTTIEIDLEARVANLEIKPGIMTPAWTYGGTVPGPLIRAHVGDRLIVHFKNSLPEETTVHWHGIRLPANMDGVPGHTQPPVKTGGTFDYSFVLPDAGLFWYHPHVTSAVQVGNGLYGAILVEDAAGDAAVASQLGDETVIQLSDIDITASGALGDPAYGGDFGTLFGRMGETLLVNGRIRPTLLARAGLRQRWRIVNSAKSRYFQLALDGNTFTRIGTDGGFIESPVTTDELVVITGGRADVVVVPNGQPGTTATVRWVPYDRGYGATYMIPEIPLFDIKFVADEPYVEKEAVPAHLRTIAPIDLSTAKARFLSLTLDQSTGKVVMGINGQPSWEAAALEALANDTEVWTVENTMDWNHPFHLHGFFFQPLDPATGAPLPSPEWYDTFDVPHNKTVQFAVKYDDREGMWMFHCHILDHADAGMMGMLMLRSAAP